MKWALGFKLGEKDFKIDFKTLFECLESSSVGQRSSGRSSAHAGIPNSGIFLFSIF